MIKEWLTKTLDVFSRRNSQSATGYKSDVISERLRNRILFLLRDVLTGRHAEPGMRREDNTHRFLEEMHNSLQHLYGRHRLSSAPVRSTAEDVEAFVGECRPAEFFDFLELTFKTDSLDSSFYNQNDLVDVINEMFRMEGAPYQLTPVVRREVREEPTRDYSPFSFPLPSGGIVIETVAWPKVVRMEEEVTFNAAEAPALTVLSSPGFATPNLEFRDALDEYRNGQYGDCLVKCCSAFESTLKILCKQKGWTAAGDTLKPLLTVVLANTTLDGFFEAPLMIIGTMRNRLGTAHGGGTTTRTVTRHVAQYAITMTAAAIVLLVHEAR